MSVEPAARDVEHVGVDLWQTFRLFERVMFERVTALGFDDITLADSNVLVHVGARGVPLATIVRRGEITRQAVHERVRSLERRGYLALGPDPADRRGRLVTRTERGRALAVALREVKLGMQSEVQDVLGAWRLDELSATLEALRGAFGNS